MSPLLYVFQNFLSSLLTLQLFGGFYLYYIFYFALFCAVIVMIVTFLRRG